MIESFEMEGPRYRVIASGLRCRWRMRKPLSDPRTADPIDRRELEGDPASMSDNEMSGNRGR